MNTTPLCMTALHRWVAISKVVFFCLLLFISISCSTTLDELDSTSILDEQSNTFTELNLDIAQSQSFTIQGEFIFLNSDNAHHQCQIWGTPWGGSNATVETLVLGTVDNPIKIDPINSANLVGIMTDSGWVRVSFGSGFYRLSVSDGSGLIHWTCRKGG